MRTKKMRKILKAILEATILYLIILFFVVPMNVLRKYHEIYR